MSSLDERVAAVRRRAAGWNAVRGGALGAGVAAVAVGLGGHPAWVAAAAAGALVGWTLRPTPVDAARRLDRAAGLDGALECAWDNRSRDSAVARAQRRRAARGLEAQEEARVLGMAVGRPRVAWALPVTLWAWVAVAPPPGSAPEALSTGAHANAELGVTDPSEGAVAARPGVVPQPGAARAATAPPTVDAAVGAEAADGGAGAGPEGVRGRVGGVGTRAGDRSGGRSGATPIAAIPGEGPALLMPRAAGVGAPGGAMRGDGPSPLGRRPADDVADPARPYPRRYREVVTGWFDRGEP